MDINRNRVGTERQRLFFHTINWKYVLSIGFTTTLLHWSIFYFHPSNNAWLFENGFKWSNLLQFLFIDQFIIEIPAVVLIYYCIGIYQKLLKIKVNGHAIKDNLLYLIKHIPLIFVLYFFCEPLSLTLRYVYHKLVWGSDDISFIEDYFFWDIDLYLAYLLPITINCFLWLVLISFKSTLTLGKSNSRKKTRLSVKNDFGKSIVYFEDIAFIEKSDRKYMVETMDGEVYTTNKNLTELENIVDSRFFRMNRSIIVNLDFIEHYSFWENQKYVIRLKNGKEIQSTMARIRKLRKLLSSN